METQKEAELILMPMRSDERLATRIATDVLTRFNHESILDIGCGDGVISKHIDPRIKYRGLDISEACIYEQERDIPTISYVHPTEIFKTVSKEKWDMVLLLDVIEHTKEFTELFEVGLSASNKYVVVSLPNELFILDRIKLLFGHEHNAHSLDLIGYPEGFRHQFLVNVSKARKILNEVAIKYNARLVTEVLRPLIPKKRIYRLFPPLLKLISSSDLWSMGSILVFEKY